VARSRVREDGSVAARFTRLAFRIHGWVGLATALLLLNVGLTGAVLVFAGEINQVLWRDLLFVEPRGRRQPLAALYERVRLEHPEADRIGIARLPGAPDRAVVFNLSSPRPGGAQRSWRLFVDPYSGAALGTKEGNAFRENPMGWVYQLHFTLHAGKAGYWAFGVLSLLLLLSITTGLYVYRRFIGRALLLQVRVRWREWRRGVSDLHRVVGVWAWLFNLIIAGTGLWFMRDVFTRDFYRGSEAAPIRHGPAPRLAVSLDALLATAARRVPDFVPQGLFIREDDAGGSARSVVLFGNDRRRFFLLAPWDSQVAFDARTGALERVSLISQAPAADKFRSAAGPMHFGSWGGLQVKVVYAAFALAPPLLALTGFALWLRRRRGSREGPDLE
jgi:uncharacterized iron-regulated membrane protein